MDTDLVLLLRAFIIDVMQPICCKFAEKMSEWKVTQELDTWKDLFREYFETKYKHKLLLKKLFI